MKTTKQNFKTFMLAIALMAAGTTAFAQDTNTEKKGREAFRGERTERMAKEFAQQLGLDEATSQKFIQVYKEQQEEKMKLMPRRGGMPPRGERPEGNGEQASQGNRPNRGMKRRAMSEEDQKKLKELDEKYDKEYAKILTKDQISKMGTIKQEMMTKFRQGNRRQQQQ